MVEEQVKKEKNNLKTHACIRAKHCTFFTYVWWNKSLAWWWHCSNFKSYDDTSQQLVYQDSFPCCWWQKHSVAEISNYVAKITTYEIVLSFSINYNPTEGSACQS